MFCDGCGTAVGSGAAFCPSCGKPQRAAPPALAARRGRIASHLQSLGIFWLAYSVFRMLTGWFFTEFLRNNNFLIPSAPLLMPHFFRGAGMILIATGVLGILTGWGLLDRQPWARTLGIVMGFLVLLHFGIGTVLGIYTLWVLLPTESGHEYQTLARTV